MKQIIKASAKGLLTYVPGIQKVLATRGAGGTKSAAYCYGVWLKHLTLLWENGMRSIPRTLAELGPGDSLGVGLSAMLCGVDHYFALDMLRHSNSDTNLRVFDELVGLFECRAPRPTKGWPDFDQYLDDKFFPSHILTDDVLNMSLSEERISAIRNAIRIPTDRSDHLSIQYMVPWSDDRIIEKDSVDLILSHSVLEHISDLESTYHALYSWIKPSGRMTHQIDFTSHGLSEKWNGYRAYPEFFWKIILGKRPFLINREPYSVHINLMNRFGFSVVCDLAQHRTDGIQRDGLSRHWRNMADDDLTCSGAFVQAEVK